MKHVILKLLTSLALLATSATAQAQLGGTKTINPAGTGANNYATFGAAVTALNASGTTAAGVTFNVAAGAVFDEVVPAIKAKGTAAGPIIFQKSGTGANPKIQGTGAGTADAGLTLDGAGFVQVLGIDVEDKAANTTTTQQLEYGYYLLNGATRNTFAGGVITLNRANTTRTAGVAQLGGGNDNNHYYGLTVQNCAYGYDLEGSANVYDDGTEIGPIVLGGASAPASRVLSIGTPAAGTTGGITGIVYGIYLRSQTGAKVSATEVSGLTGASAVYGIYSTGTYNSADVSDCSVHGLSTSASTGAAQAIYVASGTTHSFLRNRTYDVEALGTSGFASGFDITAGTVNYLSNNFVYDIRAGASTAGTSVRAFSFRGGTSYAYHNSVVIGYAATAGANKSGALYMSGAPVVDARNNIFVNLVSGLATGSGVGAAFFKSTASLAALTAGSGNNIYYAGTPSAEKPIFYGVATTPAVDQTLAQYQARAAGLGIEQASLTELPPFVNVLTNLHLQATQATLAESGGQPLVNTPLPVPRDIDLDARNQTTPDIGADEGAFTPAPDQAAPIISYTPLPNTSSAASRTLGNVSITDASGVNLAAGLRPRLYFRKKTDANVFGVANDNTGNGWKYTEAVGTASPFSFTLDVGKLRAAPVAGDSIFYFVTAQDVVTPANVGATPGVGFAATSVAAITAAPLRPAAYRVLGTLSGIKTVGTGATADYATLTAAATAFNQNELTGPLTLRLLDLTYPAETYPINFQNNTGSSATNILRVELNPALASASFVAPSTATTPLLVIDASFVTLDGRASASGATPSLLLQNDGTTTASGGIFVTGSDVTLRNLELVGSGPTAGYGAAFSGAANGTVLACLVRRFATGIQSQSNASNFTVSNNVLGAPGTAPATDKIGGVGIGILATTGFAVRENSIIGVNRPATATAQASGISVSTTSTNGLINRNLIRDIKHLATTTTASYGAAGIRLGAASATANIAVNSNVILDIASFGDAGTFSTPHGIYVSAGGDYSLAYNSVLLTGNIGTATSNPVSGGITLLADARRVRVVNNLLVNRQTLTATAGRAFAFYTAAAANLLTLNDNNSYYAASATQGRLAYVNGAEQATLAALRAATGQDAASVSVNPIFTNENLTLLLNPSQNCNLNGAGRSLTGLATGSTDDIKGVVRDANTPDIGADEFTPVALATPAAANVTVVLPAPVPPLTATGPANTTLVWYGNAALTQRLFAGASYNTGRTVAGTYTYYVLDSVNTCRSAATLVTLTINNATATRQALPGLSAELAPNPAQRGVAPSLYLDGPARSLTLEVLDALGRVVLPRQELRHAGGTASYPVGSASALAPGLYIVRLHEPASGSSTSQQLVVE